MGQTMRTSLLALSALASLISAGAATAQPACLSFPQAIADAVAFDPRIAGSTADREMAHAGVLAARARNLPQVSVFGQAGIGDDPIDRRRDDQFGLQFQQELYSFGSRKSAKDASIARLKAARLQVEETKAGIAQGVALAFLDVQRAEALVTLAEEQQDIFRQDADTAASRLARSIITLTDTSQIRARYARARSETINADVGVQIAKARLEVLTDRDAIGCLDHPSAADTLEQQAEVFLSQTADEAVDDALSRAVALRRARAQVIAARAGVTEANRANMPVLSLTAYALTEYQENVQVFDETGALVTDDIYEGDSRIGLSLTQDLYAGGRNRARRLDARARLKGARADSDLERIVVKDAVKRALAQAKAQQAAGKALLEASEQARIRLDTTRRAYDRGTKTLTDLVLATEDYFAAASQETNARFDYYASLVRLSGTMGTLTSLGGG